MLAITSSRLSILAMARQFQAHQHMLFNSRLMTFKRKVTALLLALGLWFQALLVLQRFLVLSPFHAAACELFLFQARAQLRHISSKLALANLMEPIWQRAEHTRSIRRLVN